jgi:hypothetical protein
MLCSHIININFRACHPASTRVGIHTARVDAQPSLSVDARYLNAAFSVRFGLSSQHYRSSNSEFFGATRPGPREASRNLEPDRRQLRERGDSPAPTGITATTRVTVFSKPFQFKHTAAKF